jgi:hypothetical protein
MSNHQSILDVISTISANRESGRLEILAGATQGELSFKDGKLVDARVGHLTGFRAINAVAAMRATRVSFDPAFSPLASSSITASERVVLKQFFGIDTVDPHFYGAPVVEDAIADEVEEVTLVNSSAPEAEPPLAYAPAPEVHTPPPYKPAPRFAFQRALALAVLVVTISAAAAVFVFMPRKQSTPATVAATSESSSPTAPVTTDRAPAATSPEPAVTVAQDLTGKWSVVNTVEQTSYQSFKNMKIGFALSIDQTGTKLTGKGQKVSENGQIIPANGRTPIQLEGSIKGDTVEATFFEEGSARKTNGRFVWRIDKTGHLTGIFATTAARSSGKSAARRDL